MKPPIAIAISGGIDSLVAAYILKQLGHTVVGIHFVTGYEIQTPACRQKPQAIIEDNQNLLIAKNQARKKISHIAEQLDIEIKIIDCSVEFKKTVIDYFQRSYRNGLTPNPCVVCNPVVKFGTLLDHARKLGAFCLATGHYARIECNDSGECRLFKGIDRQKDQSYFLARLNQDQLNQARFPLGKMLKTEVKELAEAKGFTPAAKGESQDICFVKGNSYAEFLAAQPGFEVRPGMIEDLDGNILGQHQGLHLFTVGQRRGINCPAAKPYYVVAMDHGKNLLKVGHKEDLFTSKCKVVDINWIGQSPAEPINVHIRIRYRHRAAASTLVPIDQQAAVVRFDSPQKAVTPGQAAVFYQNDEVLGGGWIDLNL